MARTPKEAIAVVVDIGHSVVPGSVDVKPGFLEKALQCTSMIVKRKIFSFSKDEIALVLLGTQETENNLDYEHITVPYSLGLPSWEMLEFLEKDTKGTNIHADWLDAVVVAMDLLKQQTQAKQFVEKKIVLFTDLKSPVADDKVDVIISSMQKEGYQLIVIGPDTNITIKTEEDMDDDEESHVANGTDKLKTKVELTGEALLSEILNKAGGVICNFDDAVPQLMYFQKKVVKPMPWNIVMDIGPVIKIPVAGYKKITPSKLPTWKTTSTLEKEIRVESETVYTRLDENQTPVEADDVIPGYSYGTTLVPMSDVDKDSMSYQSGSKCLSVLGFTKSKNVPRHLLVGEGIMYFTAQKNDDSGVYALSSLINAMKELDLYAIARKVYRDNLAPRLGVLLPKISSYECLVFIELPYSEDMREFVFPPIVTDYNKPSQEQLSAVDALIDNMDLTSVRNEFELTEAFKSKNILNPYHQHVYHSLSFRALNPDSELPPVRDDVQKLLRSPYEDNPDYKLAVEEIKKVFQLMEVVQKTRPKAAADVFKVDADAVKDEPMDVAADLTNITMASLIQSKIVEVGSIKPIEDFKVLIEQGQPFGEVCNQMQRVIVNLVIRSFGTDSFDKAALALRELRSTCADKDPSLYNEWIPKFRENLFERAKTAFWKKIIEGKLGLISSHESVKSSVTEMDSRNFLEYEEPKEEEAPVEEDMDEDDLLNMM